MRERSSEFGLLTDARIHECWFLTGPTASGKSEVGMRLARLIDAEIVSLDSMAVYRGMDIGTAKPALDQRQEVPHHLLDVRDPCDEFNVSQYLRMAQAAIDEIRGRNRQVLFVGGTPLYLKAALRGVFEGPAADAEFRREVEAEASAVGIEALARRLAQVDPLSAAKLHPNDKRRIIRALEVYKLTGRPISHLQLQFDEGRPAASCRVFQLSWPRAELHRRIDRRVEAMFAACLFVDVRGLLELYVWFLYYAF
jgi:tRNA dimethylallyltransferase